MIGSTRQVAVYAYGAPVDMRKGYDGLSALVMNDLGHDPLAGDFFVFVNRPRKKVTFSIPIE
jgi:transposase